MNIFFYFGFLLSTFAIFFFRFFAIHFLKLMIPLISFFVYFSCKVKNMVIIQIILSCNFVRRRIYVAALLFNRKH